MYLRQSATPSPSPGPNTHHLPATRLVKFCRNLPLTSKVLVNAPRTLRSPGPHPARPDRHAWHSSNPTPLTVVTMPIASAHATLRDAARRGYAVGHFNLNHMESMRAYLLAAEEARSPVILAVSRGPAAYMGGYRTVLTTVEGFIDYLGITVPVTLHVDHGSYDEALAGLDAGFKSVMFDGSALPFEENLDKAARLVERCRQHGATLECEVGSIGGEEDGVTGRGELADPEQCRRLAALGIDMLAAGIGNVHGQYPAGWRGLDFERLADVAHATQGTPLVLHGGSGVPEEMVRRAIELGVRKVNVNTECLVAFTAAVRRYVEAGRDREGKGYLPQALLADGLEAAKRVAMEKMALFGSAGKA